MGLFLSHQKQLLPQYYQNRRIIAQLFITEHKLNILIFLHHSSFQNLLCVILCTFEMFDLFHVSGKLVASPSHQAVSGAADRFLRSQGPATQLLISRERFLKFCKYKLSAKMAMYWKYLPNYSHNWTEVFSSLTFSAVKFKKYFSLLFVYSLSSIYVRESPLVHWTSA